MFQNEGRITVGRSIQLQWPPSKIKKVGERTSWPEKIWGGGRDSNNKSKPWATKVANMNTHQGLTSSNLLVYYPVERNHGGQRYKWNSQPTTDEKMVPRNNTEALLSYKTKEHKIRKLQNTEQRCTCMQMDPEVAGTPRKEAMDTNTMLLNNQIKKEINSKQTTKTTVTSNRFKLRPNYLRQWTLTRQTRKQQYVGKPENHDKEKKKNQVEGTRAWDVTS